MNATLGVELPFTNGNNQTTVPLGYAEPTTEIMSPSDVGTPIGSLNDGTQIWKITHNGVDTHAIHFHLFNVQLINRVGWDGAIRAPDPNELGWKETVRMNPLEDAIVALRPVTPELPFGVPDSVRPINPSMPTGMTFPTIDPITGNPSTFVNAVVNFGWEYVWHCHLLGHEENDMMRPMEFDALKALAAAPVLSRVGSGPVTGPVNLTWTDGTPGGLPLGSPAGEIGFRVERAPVTLGVVGTFAQIGTTLANKTTFSDTTAVTNGSYAYRVIAFNAAGNSTSNSVFAIGSFTLSGTVKTSTGTALPGSIAIYDATTLAYVTSVTVNASGAFSISLPSASYKLRVAPTTPGFAAFWYGGTSLATATTVNLTSNTALTITVAVNWTLSGTVKTSTGTALPGIDRPLQRQHARLRDLRHGERERGLQHQPPAGRPTSCASPRPHPASPPSGTAARVRRPRRPSTSPPTRS